MCDARREKGFCKLETDVQPSETSCPPPPRRWEVRFALQGDLRFCSHHDLMRVLERTALRAKLPLRYSKGFNPRPAMSLPDPHPVAVAGLDERLMLSVEPLEPLRPEELLERLAQQAPQGIEFRSATLRTSKKVPPALTIDYRMELPSAVDPRKMDRRIAALEETPHWSVPRRAPRSVRKRGGRGRRSIAEAPARQIDIRPSVRDLKRTESNLTFTICPAPDGWAKPAEILDLLGLELPRSVASLVRTKIQTKPETSNLEISEHNPLTTGTTYVENHAD